MKIIERIEYINQLKRVVGTPDIKVITGIRRSGKSKLMLSFIDYLKKNYKNTNIIHIDYNLTKFENLANKNSLYEYVNAHYENNKKNFLFIDEVELCEGFEKAIISLHTEEKYDIYITGSNAFLLSSDLSTLFTGRTFEIQVYPFSFKEYLLYYKNKNIDEAFNNYVLDGGMSGSYLYNNIEDKYKNIADIYKTLLLRDIKQKYKIKYIDIFNKISEYLMSNISNIVSINNILKTIKQNGINIDYKTVSKYIEYLINAFIFYKVKRYDLSGKKYLKTNEKYYLADHSFKYAVLGTRNMNYGYVYENIVAIELLRRGYELYIGILYKKEIDFVAIKKDEQIFIQVSDDISNEKTFKREVDPLLSIKNGYKKMIIANTKHDMYQYEGIEIYDIGRWLSEG